MNIFKLYLKGFSKFREFKAYYSRYFSNKSFKRYSKFARYTQKGLNNKMILYESSGGQSIDGNSYALFKYLLNNPNYSSFTHVWSTNYLNDENKMINKYKNYNNVKFVKRNSEVYLKYLATSKYVISDFTFPDYYFRRNGQIYVNCWSDTPFKVIDKDNELEIKNQGKVQRNFLNASFLIQPNEYCIDKLLSAYDVDTLIDGHVLDIGHPKADFLFSTDKLKLKNNLNISESDKVILYAPRWNGKIDFNLYVEDLINNIKFFKNELTNEFTFKVHLPLRVSKYVPDSLKDLIVPNDIDIYEIFCVIDILITNSSVSFDFLTTRKPLIYLMDDIKDDFNSYIPLEELPGPLCYDISEVIDVVNDIKSISKEYKNNYILALKKFNYNNDGNVSKRVIDAVFNGISDKIINMNNKKKKLLIYPGSLKINGITSSLLSLLNNIDYEKYDVSILLFPKSQKNKDYKDFKFNLKNLNKKANIICISKGFNFLPKEYYYHNFIMKNGISDEIKKYIPKDLYNREIRRLIGNTKFDIFIDFGGYDRLITLLFAFTNMKKIVYLHNNMIGEYELRFKTLSVTFDLYKYYNKLITVSEDSKNENSLNFKEYGINLNDKLTYVTNSINHDIIIKKASIGKLSDVNGIEYYFTKYSKNDFFINLEGMVAPIKTDINFISIGRFSPEKDHKKLLLALSKVLKFHNNIKLYLLGDGPLKESLIDYADNMGILNNVIFTGNLSNPYWLLNNCDCFISSSNHEGQGIVILEALVLGKTVISTDIVGPRGILKGGYGKLVDNNAEALAEAMVAFIEEGMVNKPFDYVKYNKIAMNQFYKEVCDE